VSTYYFVVFDCVLDKDVVLFTALIVGYNQHGLDGEALEVFEDMFGSRIKPNVYFGECFG